MAALLFNKFREDRVKVILVQVQRALLQAQKDMWLGNALSQRGQGTQHDPRIADCHDVQPTIIHNAAFQTNDPDAYDSDCDDISFAKMILMANLSSYSLDVLSEVPQHDSYPNNDVLNQSVQETQYSEQSRVDYWLYVLYYSLVVTTATRHSTAGDREYWCFTDAKKCLKRLVLLLMIISAAYGDDYISLQEKLWLYENFGFTAVLAVLVTRASQSRQHGKSESDSYYLSD
ncbi:hypothetical protein Tco_0720652 [Tanacetum coccineum]